MTTLEPGKQLGKYRLERLLGSGGMGAVWAAHDGDLDRRVALKVLRAALVGDTVAQGRLLREARAMARLKHPNVITVYDATTAEGLDLVAMELIEGETMAQWLARGETKPRPGAIIDALLAAGRGLAAAHAAGMIHRDFKPHNVLVEGGGARVLVTDFGLARASEGDARTIDSNEAKLPPAAPAPESIVEESSPPTRDLGPAVDATASMPGGAKPAGTTPHSDEKSARDRAGAGLEETVDANSASRRSSGSHGSLDSPLTRTGTLLGTPAYMAPEQFAGKTADARADQFAFCVTAWEALAGGRPFDADSIVAIAEAQKGAAAHADKIPRRLRAALLRGLAFDPKRRWSTMTDLLAALERAWHRPRRAISLGITVSAFAAAVVLFVSMRHGGSDPTPPTPPTPPGTPAIVLAGACPQRGVDAVESAWSPAKKQALAAQLPHSFTRMLDLVDRWATDWAQRFDANCAKPADPEFAIRRLCFEAMRDEVSQTLTLPAGAAAAGGKPDEVTAMNFDIARALPSPEACDRAPRELAPPIPTDPAMRTAVQALRTELVALRADLHTADHVAEMTGLVERAKAIGYPPIYAEALFMRAVALHVTAWRAKDPRAAQQQTYEAYDAAAIAAEAAGYDRYRVSSLLGQLEIATDMPDRLTTIDTVVDRTRVATDRLGEPTNAYVLDSLRGQIAFARSDWTAAIDATQRAIDGWTARGAVGVLLPLGEFLVRAHAARHAPGDLATALELTAKLVANDDIPEKIRAQLAPLVEDLQIRATGRLGEDAPDPDDVDDSAAHPDPLIAGGGDRSGGTIELASTGLSPGTLVDPPIDALDARAARTTPVRFSVAPIDGTGEPVTLPPGPTGAYTFPRVHPGRYRVTAYLETALGDRRGERGEVAVVAGKSTSISLDVAPRTAVAVTWPVRTPGVAVLLPLASLPTKSREVTAAIAKSPWFVLTETSAGGQPRHANEWTAYFSRGPGAHLVACLLPGAQLTNLDDTIAVGEGDAKPLCKPVP